MCCKLQKTDFQMILVWLGVYSIVAAREKAFLPTFSLVLGTEICCGVDDSSCLGMIDSQLGRLKFCKYMIMLGVVLLCSVTISKEDQRYSRSKMALE